MLLANSPVAKTLRPCRKESVDFDKTKNLYIEGDNLDVLKLLKLEARMNNEKQFNRRVELNAKVKKLQTNIDKLKT